MPVSVRYTVQGSSAEFGSDFTAVTSGLLTFAPGETSKAITVSVSETPRSSRTRVLTVILSDATNADIVDSSGTGTIRNDDATLQISDAQSIVEGDSGTKPLLFTISLETPSALPVYGFLFDPRRDGNGWE
jgi:hypothetical protein